MKLCSICPFNCQADRIKTFGICKLPNKILISQVSQHFFEEPMISGQKESNNLGGSGAIFFTGCNAKCVFCQNYQISNPDYWSKKQIKEVSEEELFEICQTLIQEKKVHNLNFVTPTPYSDLLYKFLKKYKKELKIPIIWNSNGYEKIETLKKLSGLIDIYLPDIKYFDNKIALKYSLLPNYFKYASTAIKEMFKQVSYPQISKTGFIKKGLIIRHLVLPGGLKDSKKILDWIYQEFGKKAFVALMSQYYPVFKAVNFKEINRKLTKQEHEEITEYFLQLGFKDGLIQDLESADPIYTPDFN